MAGVPLEFAIVVCSSCYEGTDVGCLEVWRSTASILSCPGPELESLHDVAGVGGGVSSQWICSAESGSDACSEELPCARSVALLRKSPSALSICGLTKTSFGLDHTRPWSGTRCEGRGGLEKSTTACLRPRAAPGPMSCSRCSAPNVVVRAGPAGCQRHKNNEGKIIYIPP